MSEIASQILNSFSALPETEQHEVLVALLRTSGELPSTELTDDDLVNLAEEVFLRLDAEEAQFFPLGVRSCLLFMKLFLNPFKFQLLRLGSRNCGLGSTN